MEHHITKMKTDFMLVDFITILLDFGKIILEKKEQNFMLYFVVFANVLITFP